jgi:hypothetical protein
MSKKRRVALRPARRDCSSSLCRYAENVCVEHRMEDSWLDPVQPSILSITSTHPDRRSFTRFIPAQNGGRGVGMWRHYYARWGEMTIDQLSPEMIGQAPDLAKFFPPARALACVFALDRHRPAAARAGVDTVIITCCGNRCRHAGDHAGRGQLGLRVHPRVTDTVCSSPDETQPR